MKNSEYMCWNFSRAMEPKAGRRSASASRILIIIDHEISPHKCMRNLEVVEANQIASVNYFRP